MKGVGLGHRHFKTLTKTQFLVVRPWEKCQLFVK